MNQKRKRDRTTASNAHLLGYAPVSPRRRWMCVWALPLLWLPCGFGAALVPSDLNLTLFLVTFPGSWVTEILTLHDHVYAYAQIAGTLLVLAGVGVMFDLLRASRGPVCIFLVLLPVCATVALIHGLSAALILYSWGGYVSIVGLILWKCVQLVAKSRSQAGRASL